MKFKFKYVSMLVIAALMAGVTSCSDKDPVLGGEEGTDLTQPREGDLTIQIEIPGAEKSRAESTTNVGIYPHVFDLTLVFVGKTTANSPIQVLKVIEGDVPALTNSGQKFKSLPLGVTGLYVIGNTDPAKYDKAVIEGYNAGTDKDQFGLLALKNRTDRPNLLAYNPKETAPNSGVFNYIDVTTFMEEVRISLDNYNLTDAKAVNVTGYAPILGTQGTTPVRVIVTPAISRYEIREIRSKYDDATSDYPSFKLNGIYISNTMREISVDGQKYPNPVNEPELVLNYGWNTPAWNYSLWNLPYDTWNGFNSSHSDFKTNRDAMNPWYNSLTDGREFYKYKDYARNTAAYVEHHSYDRKGDLNPYPAATPDQDDIWKKWRETDLSKVVTKDNGAGNPYSYTPSSANPMKYWSFYIASARQQETPAEVDNPYLDEGYYNRVGFRCGTWPYNDERVYVEGGYGLQQNSPLGSYPMAGATYSTEMNIPAWATKGEGIPYGVFPTICIHVTLDANAADEIKEGWLTVTKFLDAATGLPLQYPKPGTVYVIKTIAFDAKTDIKPDPMWPTDETDISVEVEVRGWVGQDTIVEF